ncbi:MAG: hypothetical protein ACRCVE_05435 [Plesiomonas sp.]
MMQPATASTDLPLFTAVTRIYAMLGIDSWLVLKRDKPFNVAGTKKGDFIALYRLF